MIERPDRNEQRGDSYPARRPDGAQRVWTLASRQACSRMLCVEPGRVVNLRLLCLGWLAKHAAHAVCRGGSNV